MGSFGENPRLTSTAAALVVPGIEKADAAPVLIGFALQVGSC
jgi:hypothetical protein